MSILATKLGPDFIIIGAMKCMTSTLHEQLAAQPGILMADPKEPCYFSDDDVHRKGMAWYTSLFSARKASDLCGEASTHYTKLPTYPKTIERMHEACSDVKLIYIMRHPIDRLQSQYIHEWTQRVVSEPIDLAIDSFPELVEYSRYAYQLKGYLSTFGPRQLLPVFFDRLASQPQEELERICRFIGYGGQPVWRDYLKPDNVSSKRMRTSRWRDRLAYAPGVSWVRRTLVPQGVRDRIKRLWQTNRRPTISVHRLKQLQKVFDEDLNRLGDWLGIALSCDVFRATTAERALDWREGLEAEFKAAERIREVAI